MIKRLLVIIAFLLVAGAVTWMHWDSAIVLPVTICGIAVVFNPIGLLIIAAGILMITLAIGFLSC
jgi:hypothetical protein